jgi:hypothetical protein
MHDRYIMDRIEREEIRGIAYAHAICKTEKSLGSYIVEYKITPVHIVGREWEETRAYREILKERERPSAKLKRARCAMNLLFCPEPP